MKDRVWFEGLSEWDVERGLELRVGWVTIGDVIGDLTFSGRWLLSARGGFFWVTKTCL